MTNSIKKDILYPALTLFPVYTGSKCQRLVIIINNPFLANQVTLLPSECNSKLHQMMCYNTTYSGVYKYSWQSHRPLF